MDTFLDTYDQPKLNQEDINHLNRSITSNEIEAAITISQKKRFPELWKTIKELTPTLLTLSPWNKKGRKTTTPALWRHYSYPKTGQGHENNKRELWANLFNEHRCKNSH
jgi:hypothetical protein